MGCAAEGVRQSTRMGVWAGDEFGFFGGGAVVVARGVWIGAGRGVEEGEGRTV